MIRTPIATYRLQLHGGFGFEAVAAISGYLDALGVSDVYLSPCLAAEAGSRHGYNLIAHDRINPELGGEEGLYALSRVLRARGMGAILDTVPNHMGIATSENLWWNDVLENGPSALHAEHFDIDWRPPKRALRDKVLLPILGAQYGEVLERAELQLAREGGAFWLRYFTRRLPLAPRSSAVLLERAIARVSLPEEGAELQELRSIHNAIGYLPTAHDRVPERRLERAREKEIVKRRLSSLCAASEPVARAIDEVLAETNGAAGDPGSFDALDAILSEQCFRLSSWRVAAEQINYRRFFDINDLAAIRMEDPAVFEATHALVLRLAAEGVITGIRLDHTDGLYDPAAYFAALQARLASVVPGASTSGPVERAFYVVAEKILGAGEQLPGDWRVHGTTGYDFIGDANGLWVDPRGELPLTAFYRRFTGDAAPFDEQAYLCKRLIMRSALASEVNVLAAWLERIASGTRRWRDFTLGSLTTAIVETIAAFPVYRTYVRGDAPTDQGDRERIGAATGAAAGRTPEVSETVFQYLREILLLEAPGTDEAQRAEHARFAQKFQQVTGPVMAKAIEDTAFYRSVRLTSLNEVGSHPGHFGTSIEQFHAGNTARAARWPGTMTALSTHDTKRGEDVRARISVLSEVPTDFRHALGRWTRLARRHLGVARGRPAPSTRDEYLFYQTLLGAMPLELSPEMPADPAPQARSALGERLVAYMHKAAKEAKLHTAWVNPDGAYEDALAAFVRGMIADDEFFADARCFAASLDVPGATNGLAQTLLRLTSPGVPDMYQGTELWSQTLVDPDNRGDVDFASRRRLLAGLQGRLDDRGALARELLGRFRDGQIKLFVTHLALALRRQLPDVFARGAYTPLEAGEHAVAFARELGGQCIVTCVPRLSRRLAGPNVFPLGDTWGDLRVPLPRPGRYRDVLTDLEFDARGDAPLGQVLSRLPVALLQAI
jgi:(1->4)-alpha-D-glucan 1-alpha-D-glucosylmutase